MKKSKYHDSYHYSAFTIEISFNMIIDDMIEAGSIDPIFISDVDIGSTHLENIETIQRIAKWYMKNNLKSRQSKEDNSGATELIDEKSLIESLDKKIVDSRPEKYKSK